MFRQLPPTGRHLSSADSAFFDPQTVLPHVNADFTVKPLATLLDPGIGSGIDVAATSNGTQGLSIGSSTLYVHYFPQIEASTNLRNLFCVGTGLGVCNTSSSPGDARVEYDQFSQRWIVSAVWPNGANSAWNTIAVSRTTDAAGGYYVAQYLSCDAVENQIDQPRLGYNDRWIVVSTLCPNRNDPGLAVFDKAILYAGSPLQETRNFFKLRDPINLSPIQRDQPTRTYTVTAGDREYLVEPTVTGSIPNSIAETIYSFLDGATDNPILHSSVATYSSNFYGELLGLAAVGAPSCSSACIHFLTYTNIHSATVNASLPNGIPIIYTTSIYGNRNYSNSTEIISTAVNSVSGVSRSVAYSDQIANGGAMASEIAVPDVASYNTNFAMIGYADSNANTYPSTRTLEWNVDANSITYQSYLELGNHTPSISTQGDGSRWIDFLDAACTVPNYASVLIGGSAAIAGSADADRTLYLGQGVFY